MQQNNGFEKVQSLLSELLNTAREKLHHNNMLNRQATARCDVYNHKLAERSEYLNSVVDSLNAERSTVQEASNHAGEAIKSRIALGKTYAGLSEAEKKRFANEKLFYDGLRNTINSALTSVNDIASQLKSNNLPTPSFVQTSIKKITDSYHRVFNMKIDIPESFIQMSIDNDAARRRIISWLDDIKMTFSAMVSSIDEDSKTRSDNNGKFEALLDKIVEALKAENENITVLKGKYVSLMKSYDENISSFGEFKTKNAANLAENKEYCSNEQAAYEKVKANSESNVKIYEELMNYFLENYRKISKMINDKYKRLD
jgi:DNA-binding transcriptional ArsR family regulator